MREKRPKGPKGLKRRGSGGAALLGGLAPVGRWLAKSLPQASLQSLLSLASLFVALALSLAAFSTLAAEPTVAVSAHQRYPWNGKVDVDFTLTGDADENYLISLAATDVAGGTNLPVKTISVGAASLPPGTHRLVWDADADIAADAELPRVTMSATATLQQRYSVRFNANGGEGTMADETFVTNEVKSLTANAFTRTGYAFSGWATSASGEVAYADKAEVENLTPTHRGVVDLYAVWSEIPLYMVVNLKSGADGDYYPIGYLADVPTGGWTDEYKTSFLVLRRVDPGTYVMQEKLTPYADPDESRMDARTVTISRPFYIGIFEVTQKQYANVMGSWPSFFQNTTYAATRPVESINWRHIRGAVADYPWPQSTEVLETSFVGRLRSRAHKAFDLPLESQWEYACRAGTQSLYYGYGVAEVARYWNNGGSTTGKPPYTGGNTQGNWEAVFQGTATVGSYTPNSMELYDMLGNVKEWVLNDQSGTSDPTSVYRIARGGSWQQVAYGCTCISRYSVLSTKEVGSYGTAYNTACIDVGFRIACPAE